MKENTESVVEKDWKYAGLRCMVVFVRKSHRCGYVRIQKGNPGFEMDYNDIPVEVHGGLTFASNSVLSTNKKDGYWWFGFDCAHLGDAMEGELSQITLSLREGHHWTTDEVAQETESLARQLSKLTWKQLVKSKLKSMPKWFQSRAKVVEHDD